MLCINEDDESDFLLSTFPKWEEVKSNVAFRSAF